MGPPVLRRAIPARISPDRPDKPLVRSDRTFADRHRKAGESKRRRKRRPCVSKSSEIPQTPGSKRVPRLAPATGAFASGSERTAGNPAGMSGRFGSMQAREHIAHVALDAREHVGSFVSHEPFAGDLLVQLDVAVADAIDELVSGTCCPGLPLKPCSISHSRTNSLES